MARGGGYLEHAQQIAAAALPIHDVLYGGREGEPEGHPWEGSMRSVAPDKVPRHYVAGGDDAHFLPRSRSWKRRGGQTQKFDTFAAPVGHLPAKWGAKARWMEEFLSESISDNVPTLATLLSKETIAAGLDDGRFSQLWIRDQVGNLNYTLGDEYGPISYPDPGAEQSYKIIPLWHESGEGGMTRGVTEFSRRMFFGGSRRFQKVGNWWYLPSRYGTPSRWRGRFTPRATAEQEAFPVADTGAPGIDWGKVGGPVSFFDCVNDTAPDLAGTDYIRKTGGLGNTGCGVRISNAGIVDPGIDYGFVLRLTMRITSALANMRLTVDFANASGAAIFAGSRSFGGPSHAGAPAATEGNVTALFATYDIALTAAECALLDFAQSWDATFGYSGAATSGADLIDISAVELVLRDVSALEPNRLIPSGPLPPTHAGTLAKGNPVSGGTATSLVPNGDVADGAWTDQVGATVLNIAIDDTTDDDTDYIQCAAGGALCEIDLTTPSVVPASTDSVRVIVRASKIGLLVNTLTVHVRAGGATQATMTALPGFSFANFTLALTAAQIAAITAVTADWSGVTLRFTATGATTSSKVARAYVSVAPSDASIGGWKGHDRFYYSLAYRFEDDSVWMPCTPRAPNTLLPAGFNLFTVDLDNPDNSYDSVVWSNLPIGPHGVKSKLLLRTTKIDATTDDNLQLNPRDLRIVWEVANEVTTYADYYADDLAPFLDAEEALVRFDHVMPPRARYIFGGDMRTCVAYGGLNPCAIEIAPAGAAAAYDRNLADDNASAFAADATFMRVIFDGTSNRLELKRGSGTTVGLTFTAYATIQDLVDRINATLVTDLCGQWRAQLCPGADPAAPPATALTPHSRDLTACTVAGQTITRASGLNDIAVGAFIAGTGASPGAYVSRIDSDLQLTFVGTITAGAKTLTFYADTGDAPPSSVEVGWQRVIANSLPGFLYFNATWINRTPLEKDAVWMTVAKPGSAKAAANCFSGKIANKFKPAVDAGIAMGGGAVDNGFVVLWGGSALRPDGITGAIRNEFNNNSGRDEDYRLAVLNENVGCCAWNTIIPGPGAVPFLSPHGMMVADLKQVALISDRIYVHAPTARGDFDYEMPLCVAATASDTDGAYAIARFMRGALWINYRASGTHPNRQVCQDISDGSDRTGVAAFFRRNGVPHGFSTPLSRSMTVMASGRRSDGLHLYGWNDENAGSTGDGRVDEMETTDADNGVDIVGSVETPPERAPDGKMVSAQEVYLEHLAPAGSTGALDLHRSYADAVASLTPSTSAAFIREVKMLPQVARASTAAVWLGYRQLTGGAREVRSMRLRLKYLPSFK